MATAKKVPAKKVVKNPFKKGVKVQFVSKVQAGVGKIVSVRETVRGNYYDVQHGADKRIVSMRAANMVVAK